nr:probable protein phosphatase 2C 52 [Tanacetum cinerariifolium]
MQSILKKDLTSVTIYFTIWDVLSNQQVIEIVSSVPTRSSAARILVDSAAREWKSKYPTSKMDDCAVVCMFLDGKMDSESDNEEHGFSSATLQSNAGESDDGQNPEPFLQRNPTVRSLEEINSDAHRREQIHDSLIAIQLTVDLKPDLPREAERIKRCKGRVFALQDEPEVSRVWLPFDDAPGLAMARAFGDFCLKDFGVISIPEVSHRILTESDKFIVLASDGIWDVLSNQQVIEIVSSVPTRSSAARILVDSAAQINSDAHRREQNNVAVEGNGDATTIEVNEDQNWSGLEGVTRVNSLVQLPRFSQEQPRT